MPRSIRDLTNRAILFLCLFAGMASAPAQFTHLVTRSGDKLMDGDRQLRFISFNTPNLHYLEDYLPFDGTNPWRLPDEGEIRDALTAIRQLGGKVTRMYVLSVRRLEDEPGIIRHVEGPGVFNEEAFVALDRVMKVANEVGVRVIIPFVDNWKWWGGPKEYAGFRGKQEAEFWTDPQIIEDMKATIRFVVNRRNTLTGAMYKDDKALLCWETGNELGAPYSWTREIAAYVKTLDSNHLLMEGIRAGELSQEALDDPNLDILSTHHYGDPLVSIEKIVANAAKARGKKPYVVGEYGIVPTQDIRVMTDTIMNQGIAGGMLWSLRYRNREGGFYHHHEYNNVGAYRWPGFLNGSFCDEEVVLTIMREKAYQIDGLPVPRLPIPEPPVLLPISDVSAISWRGSTGASSYVVQRQETESSEWVVVAENVDESRYQYRPLFSDETAEIGKRYTYRVLARNESGMSAPSDVIGPVEVTWKTIVDEMENFDRVFQKEGSFTLLSVQDIRKAKEDRSRVSGSSDSYLVYKVVRNAVGVVVDAFLPNGGDAVQLMVSSDGEDYDDLEARRELFVVGKNDYGYFDAARWTARQIPSGTRYVKIVFQGGVQLSRVEVSYGD